MARPFARINVEFFLDAPAVMAAVDRKSLRVLAGAGGTTRVTMKNQVRRKVRKPKTGYWDRTKHGSTGGSLPGKPPRRRIGGIYYNIWFALDPITLSVVTGPTVFEHTEPRPITQVLNEGGVGWFLDPAGERQKASYRARPYSGEGTLAWEKGLDRFQELTEKIPLT